MKFLKAKYWHLIIILIVFGCKNDSKNIEIVNQKEAVENALFEYLDSEYTGIDFNNTIAETERFNFLLYEYLYNGGGVAIGDINNDGLPDLYFSGNTVNNKLYLNLGNFKFQDITESAGVKGGRGFKTGVSMVDINNDGLLDIYVVKSALPNTELRRNVLYINNGDLTFTESAAEYGLDDPGYGVQAYFFDMDGDGDLDVYILNHPADMRESNSILITQHEDGTIRSAEPQSYEYISDRLYKNNNNKFVDISESAGILNNAFGLSAVIADFNNDNLLDIYVANDYVKPDLLLINQGDNTFVNELDNYFSQTSFSSMGTDYADINNNGCFDLLSLDMLAKDNFRRKMLMMAQNYDKFEKLLKHDLGVQITTNALQLNSCIGQYSNIAFLNDVALTDWSWSVLLADFDNDGLKDIHITNGYLRDITNNDYAKFEMDRLQKQLNAKEITLLEWIEQIPSVAVPSYLFQNKGNITFEDASKKWNSGPPAFSNGSAYADLNNNGFLDLVVNNINTTPFIMRNKGDELTNNNFITLQLLHQKGKSHLGTIAKAHLSDGTILTELYSPTRGFLSSSQHRLHFGIKENLSVAKIDIIWPDGKMQSIENPSLNQILSIERNPEDVYTHPEYKLKYFNDVSELLPKNNAHIENSYIDFKREPLLHHKYSEEGPAVSVGDVTGNGLEDIFLGGAMGYAAKLFIQNQNGTFSEKLIPAFQDDKHHEDVSALFFDANGNGYLDLYVVSGGSEKPENDPFYQDRLYINDGKGNFTRDFEALPTFFSSGGVVVAQDIDGDGQLDLFVGGRVTPGKCPVAPKSYLLKNNQGRFTDSTNQWSEGLQEIGMVTDAAFADLDNDGNLELIVSGEWMPISIFKRTSGKYKNVTKDFGLSNKIGWWYSILVEDMTGNGYPDIIGGNMGLNSILKASDEEPLRYYYKDFDNNGSLDAVLCYYNEGVSYPLHNRTRLLEQMIFLRKRFTRYEPYAKATINDVFTKQELKGANILEANHLQHTAFINNGKEFKAKALPRYTQISVVKSIQAIDMDKDGHKDLVIGGNFYGTDAELGRFDASVGALLLGDGNGNFTDLPPTESGLLIPGNVRHIVPISIQGKLHYWIVRNNDKSSLIEVKH